MMNLGQLLIQDYRIANVRAIPREIAKVPLNDPLLIYKVCQKMEKLCDELGGVGLSAVQVGIPWELFVVKSDGNCPVIFANRYGCFINCEYESVTEKKVVSLEGCLSVRSEDGQLRLFQVDRFIAIRLKGLQLTDDNFELSFKPIDVEVQFQEQGVVFQHEIDHARSILLSDIGREIFVW